jgi:folate-binding Fe-S cluster repair protein YgfZ
VSPVVPRRAVLAIEGEDRIPFLQGLVSNDVAAAEPGHAVWAALLTPQGKWLADFFIFADGERLLLDCERDQVPDVLRRLSRYRLRSKATLRIADELAVYAAWDGEEPGLLGSTEWAEAHAAELQRKAAVYINSDSNGRGGLGASGSHTLEAFVKALRQRFTARNEDFGA